MLDELLVLLLFAILCPHGVSPFSVKLVVPTYPKVGERVLLECHHDLRDDHLSSIKWFKDNDEIFRYTPRMAPISPGPAPHDVRVNLEKSSSSKMFLESVTLRASGVYRCEVTGEGPAFNTAFGESRMEVVHIPDESPKISIEKNQYEVGEVVSTNCTSGMSNPETSLEWYINDEPVRVASWLRRYQTRTTNHSKAPFEGVLKTSILGLEFRVRPEHFQGGTLKLRCVASLSTDRAALGAASPILQNAQLIDNWEASLQLKGEGCSVTGNALLLVVAPVAALLALALSLAPALPPVITS